MTAMVVRTSSRTSLPFGGWAAWLGSSEMATLVRTFDWAQTPLGPIEAWPQSLKSAVAICLRSPFQMAIYWGPELNCIYNDAERDVLGRLHPEALGLPARELLRDSWPIVGPQLQAVIEQGTGVRLEDQPLGFDRRERPEAAYFTYSFSPVLADDVEIGGVLLITEDTTKRVLAHDGPGGGTRLRSTQNTLEAGPIEAALTPHRPRVLVAEDNPDMREYLHRLLAPHYSVALAPDGSTVWELALRDPPGLVISDVMMPGLDGFGLIRELRRHDRTRDVPVILLSARADPDSTLRALELGADDYIIKPFGAPELLARVHATLQNARARTDAAAARGKLQERERHEGELRALLTDLRAAQRRVAAAGDAERRRVERDLHDGAQQRLMAIRLELGLVRELLEHDPRAAGQRLDELHHELDGAVEQLRELAHGLYPPLLASDGLHAALVSVARHSAVPVTVDGDGMTRAPRPVESAAYFCCLEALQNATKHAGPGANVSIHLSMSGQALNFRVSDDGAGFDPDAVRPGYGLINLRDRIDALGGHVEVASAPGRGTTVEGRIPVL